MVPDLDRPSNAGVWYPMTVRLALSK